MSTTLSKMDWFGLITGIIGLCADILALSALFYIAPKSESFNNFAILIVLLSIYTPTAIGVLSRRFFVSFNAKKHILSRQDFLKIEKACSAITFFITLSIFTTFIITLFGKLPLPRESVEFGQAEKTIVFIIWVVISIIISLIISYSINRLCRTIYSGLDVSYESDKKSVVHEEV